MKKFIAVCILFCLILYSCQSTDSEKVEVTSFGNESNIKEETPITTINENSQFSRIIVIKNPDSMVLESLYKTFGQEYDSYQNALDDLVNRYNKSYDNNDLLRICIAISFSGYIENSEQLKIEYYFQFFNMIWKDQNFKQETTQYQESLAEDLISSMYAKGMKTQTIEFYNKYVDNIQDDNSLVIISAFCSNLYRKDSNPDHESLVKMFEISKKIEENYYNKVSIVNKIIILKIIANYANLLNDETIENEYNKKVDNLMKSMNSK